MGDGKVWFVTGAGRGFGRYWAEAALKRGDRVIATARNPEAFSELVKNYGDAVLPLSLDVTDRDGVFSTMQEGHRRFGRLDVVVSAAGYGYMGAVEELEPEAAKANFETNVWGTLSVIQAALPIMRAQGSGHILTVSSIAGILSFPVGGPYLATKHAVEAFSEALAGEVAGFGIKVTIVEPGSFRTEFDTSIRFAPTLPVYDPVRQAVFGSFDPNDSGDPKATGPAILAAVDAEQPPLRLVLGSKTIPMFRAAYEQRLNQWDAWAEVSNAAQG